MNTLFGIFGIIALVWYLVGTFTYSQWITNQTHHKRNPDAWRLYARKHILSLSGKIRAPMYYMFIYHSRVTDYVDVDADETIIPILIAACTSALAVVLLMMLTLLSLTPLVPLGILASLAGVYGVFQLGKRI